MLSVHDLKAGIYFVYQNEPYVVLKHDFIKMAQSKGMMRVTIKNLTTGKIISETFKGSEKLEPAEITRSKASYLYNENGEYYFMKADDYDQFFVTGEQLGEKKKFLKEGLEVDVISYEHKPLAVELPTKLSYTVQQAPPGVRGDTAQGSVTKKVTIENGYVVDVPLFIKQGEEIIVNTDTGKYVGKK